MSLSNNARARELLRKIKWIFLVGVGFALVLGGLIFWYFSSTLPPIFSISDYKPPAVTEVIAMDGEKPVMVGEYFQERRYLVPYERIPKIVVESFVAAEDDTFFEHQGVNPLAIMRAAWANMMAGHVVQGGSTITQQVAKTLFLTPERTAGRKIREVFLANRLERNMTKEQILYLYLNQIYLGHGAYGIQAAAQAYFRKDVHELTLAEAAILAGMPRAPGKMSPLLAPERAKERQRYVLKRLVETGKISKEEMVKAVAEPVKVFRHQPVTRKFSPYYVEHVRKYLAQKFGEETLYRDGFKIYLPTQLKNLFASRKGLQAGLRLIDKRAGWRGAAKKFETAAQAEEFLKKQREDLVDEKIPFDTLAPDGKLKKTDLSSQGILSEEAVLDHDRIYDAVVVGVDDKKKTIQVRIGGAALDVPAPNYDWAFSGKFSGVARLPSKVVKPLDVVKVKALRTPKLSVWLDQEPLLQGALYSYDVKTGGVLALEGGYDFDASEFNRATQAERQPGSAFKPVVYSAAIENGYTPASIVVDAPIVFKDSDFGKWRPANYSEKFYGDTTLHTALANSINIPTIKLVQEIGIGPMIKYGKRLGLQGKYPEDLSLSLGSLSTTLEEVARVFSIFPNHGKRTKPIFIQKVLDREGKTVAENVSIPTLYGEPQPPAPSAAPEVASAAQEGSPPANGGGLKGQHFPPPAGKPEYVLDPRVAGVMTAMLKSVVAYGTGRKALALNRPSAGKTGTTSDYKDAWYIGFTPDVVTGVWVGYDDPALSLGHGETGGDAALPIWLDFMKEATADRPAVDFDVPDGVTVLAIDPQKGTLRDPKDPSGRLEAFIVGMEPSANGPSREKEIENETEFLKETF